MILQMLQGKNIKPNNDDSENSDSDPEEVSNPSDVSICPDIYDIVLDVVASYVMPKSLVVFSDELCDNVNDRFVRDYVGLMLLANSELIEVPFAGSNNDVPIATLGKSKNKTSQSSDRATRPATWT
ncbi:unnamed protein product [Citrullus colocynthis]|uniref:Uncharacterized protein n=1 Tax=Citrullus colocynthis TaxID=252529 RepID=A0ABP0YV00_9ROSI